MSGRCCYPLQWRGRAGLTPASVSRVRCGSVVEEQCRLRIRRAQVHDARRSRARACAGHRDRPNCLLRTESVESPIPQSRFMHARFTSCRRPSRCNGCRSRDAPVAARRGAGVVHGGPGHRRASRVRPRVCVVSRRPPDRRRFSAGCRSGIRDAVGRGDPDAVRPVHAYSNEDAVGRARRFAVGARIPWQ